MTLRARLGIAGVALLLTVTHSVQQPTQAAHGPEPHRPYLLGLTNGYRLAHGKRAALAGKAWMWSCAQDHAERMARSARLFHSDCPFSEVVGQGDTRLGIFRAFVNSSPHGRVLRCRCSRQAWAAVWAHGRWWVVGALR